MLWKVNNYTMDLDNAVVKAIEDGGENIEDVIAHVHTNWCNLVDESEIREMYDEFWDDKMSEGYA
jgi:hypothetical protein|tara:strand:+ start:55 stop:249 length:195 start_codon:yes stop_codon:yes gene_type:complete